VHKVKAEKEQVVKARTIMVRTTDDKEFKLVVPAGSKLTFGPAVPYANKPGYPSDGGRGYALRVYAGKAADTLMACFCNVAEFRDLSLEVAKLVIREAGKTVWKSDEKGYSTTTEASTEREFIPSDKLLKG